MDNRDFQKELNKASEESEATPFTIQDLITFAQRDGIKCENCINFYSPFPNAKLKEYKDLKECMILKSYTPKNTDSFFCSNFKRKD